MRSVNSSEENFWVIAHRGYSKRAPENTMSAFRLAHEAEANMIELDVILTNDRIPVVVHDNHLKNYGYKNKYVTNLSFEELQQIDAGSWFSHEFSSEKIPALDKVLKWAKGKISLNIEIKPESVTGRVEDGIEELVIEQVQKHQMQEYVLLSSFDYRAVKRFKKIDPGISSGLLYEKKQASGLNPVELIKNLNADTFHCTWMQLRWGWLKMLKDIDIPVFIYTVNNKWVMQKIIRKGVAGIFSDDPSLLKFVAEKELQSI